MCSYTHCPLQFCLSQRSFFPSCLTLLYITVDIHGLTSAALRDRRSSHLAITRHFQTSKNYKLCHMDSGGLHSEYTLMCTKELNMTWKRPMETTNVLLCVPREFFICLYITKEWGTLYAGKKKLHKRQILKQIVFQL